MYIQFNPNPDSKKVGDCSVRAICKALDLIWEDAYISLVAEGFRLRDMPSSNYVLGNVLFKHGFTEKLIPHNCPNCTTVRQFSEDHREGIYVVIAEKHAVTIVDGDYYDSWDSGDEVALFCWEKEA